MATLASVSALRALETKAKKSRKRQGLHDLLEGWNSIPLREETERVSREYDRRNRIVDNGWRMFE